MIDGLKTSARLHAVEQAHLLDRAFREFAALSLGHTAIHERQLHVVEYVGPGDQVECLEDEADQAVANLGELALGLLGDHLAVKRVRTAGGYVQAANDIHQC
jgi:hypothetical protein